MNNPFERRSASSFTQGYLVPAAEGRSLVEAKGSLFYGRALRVEDEDGLRAVLANARGEHPEANHHAFAYRLGSDGSISRFSDDGEPGGTAGRPMMEVLLRASLVYAIVVVSRHFGGTLLGAGGLARAYGGSAAAAVREAGTAELQPHRRLRLRLDYSQLGAVQHELRVLGLRAPREEFAADVLLTLTVPADQVRQLTLRLADLTAGRAPIDELDTVYLPRYVSGQ